MGMILMAFAMMIAGLIIAFTRGWSFSLVIMAAFPFMAIGSSMIMKVMQEGFKQNMKAYG